MYKAEAIDRSIAAGKVVGRDGLEPIAAEWPVFPKGVQTGEVGTNSYVAALTRSAQDAEPSSI